MPTLVKGVIASLVVLALMWMGSRARELARGWDFESQVQCKEGRILARGPFDLGWAPLPHGRPVHEGLELRVDQARHAQVQLDGVVELRLAPNTRVQFDRIRNTDKGLELVVRLAVGRMWIDRDTWGRVTVATDAGSLELRGRSAEVQVGPTAMRATAWSGELRWTGSLAVPAKTLAQGYQLTVPYGQKIAAAVVASMDPWQRWNRRLSGLEDTPVASARRTPTAPEPRPAMEVPLPRSVALGAPGPPLSAPVPGQAARQPSPAPPEPEATQPRSAMSTTPRTPVAAPPGVENAPSQVAHAPAAPGTVRATGAPGWEEPPWLTKAGLPRDLEGIDLPSWRPEAHVLDGARAREIFTETVRLMEKHYAMGVSLPVQFHFVKSNDYSVLDRELGMQRTVNGVHEIYVLQGLEGDEFWAACAHEYAHAWFGEHARARGQQANEGFATWIEFKLHMLRGARSIARSFIDPEDFYMPAVYEQGLAQMVAIERRLGEAGVFRYVTTGVEP